MRQEKSFVGNFGRLIKIIKYAFFSQCLVCQHLDTCEKAIGTLMALLRYPRRSQEFRCLHRLLCGELAIQTLVLRPSKCHEKNNTLGGDKQCEAMHFK